MRQFNLIEGSPSTFFGSALGLRLAEVTGFIKNTDSFETYSVLLEAIFSDAIVDFQRLADFEKLGVLSLRPVAVLDLGIV